VILLTLVAMVAAALPNVPRPAIDFSQWPVLRAIDQPEGFGPDTIADGYEARVVLHDVRDMYTKRGVDQTALEASTWSKEASSPYPPVTLLALAGLAFSGQALGVGLYGMVALLAVLFLGLSLAYCLRTRWYLFPLLYLNFSFLAWHFFYMQQGSYLVMLTVIMVALHSARRFPSVAHALMAVATTIKLSPLYYARHVQSMPRRVALAFVAILVFGLVAPYFIWEDYLSIFRYHSEFKGDALSAAGAFALAAPFAAVLWYVEDRRAFDLEDLIGWGLVPVALFLAFQMNSARHLVMVLLIPDKRGVRNAAAALGLGLHALVPGLPLNSTLPLMTLVLAASLYWHLREIGWEAVRRDWSVRRWRPDAGRRRQN
jgi:hypothetical protein